MTFAANLAFNARPVNSVASKVEEEVVDKGTVVLVVVAEAQEQLETATTFAAFAQKVNLGSTG